MKNSLLFGSTELSITVPLPSGVKGSDAGGVAASGGSGVGSGSQIGSSGGAGGTKGMSPIDGKSGIGGGDGVGDGDGIGVGDGVDVGGGSPPARAVVGESKMLTQSMSTKQTTIRLLIHSLPL